MDDLAERIGVKVRTAYDAFNRGDFDTAIEIMHPDVEFVTAGGLSSLRGVAAVRAWMEPETLESVAMEIEELTVAGDKVLVRQLGRGRGASSGIRAEMRSWAVWTIDENLLATRVLFFVLEEEADARREAGLSR